LAFGRDPKNLRQLLPGDAGATKTQNVLATISARFICTSSSCQEIAERLPSLDIRSNAFAFYQLAI